MKDLTDVIFINSAWLLAVLLFYYLLSTLKVFLLVNIQRDTFSNPESFKISPFAVLRQYSKSIFNDPNLNRNTLRYLFGRGDEQTWRLLDNKNINLYYKFLDVLTTLLKPYLIIAVIWAILKIRFVQQIRYDEMQITLAQIQLRLFELKSNKVFDHFLNFKNWYYIGTMIMLLFLSVAKIWENRISALKRIISTGFTVCSILFTLSFFGNNLAQGQNEYSKELQDLDLSVRNIHGMVYKKTAVEIISRELEDALAEDIQNTQNEVSRMDSLIGNAPAYFPEGEYPARLTEKLNAQKVAYIVQSTIESPPPVVHSASYLNTSFFELNEKIQPAAVYEKSTNNYWDNKGLWNKKDGLESLKKAEAIKKSSKILNPENTEKIHAIAESILEELIGQSTSKLASSFGLNDLKSLNAVLEFVSFEGTKSSLRKAVNTTINALKNMGDFTFSFTERCISKDGKSAERIAKTRAQHDAEVIEVINEELKVAARKKVNVIADQIMTKIVGNSNAISIALNMPERLNIALQEEYFKGQAMDELALARYKNLLIDSKIPNTTIIRALGSVIHPFPKPTCPLCIYKRTLLRKS